MAIAVEEVPVVIPDDHARQYLDLFPDKVEIDVTYDDIANGERRSADRCPVARAVGRRFDGAYIQVTPRGVMLQTEELEDFEEVRAGYMAEGLYDFVRTFDFGGECPAPMTLTLRRVY